MCEGGIVGYRKFGDEVSKGGGRVRGTWKRQIGRQKTIATRDEWEFYTNHCGVEVVEMYLRLRGSAQKDLLG